MSDVVFKNIITKARAALKESVSVVALHPSSFRIEVHSDNEYELKKAYNFIRADFMCSQKQPLSFVVKVDERKAPNLKAAQDLIHTLLSDIVEADIAEKSIEDFDESRDNLGLSKRAQSQYSAFKDVSKMIDDFQALSFEQKQAQRVDSAKKSIAKLGYYRVHPSVAKSYNDKREILAFIKGDKVLLKTGEPYWGELAADAKGKHVVTFDSLSAMMQELYKPN